MDVASTSGEVLPVKRWRLRLPERLPNLKGKWLTLYSLVWAIILPLALIASARGTYVTLTNPTMWTPYGFATTDHAEGLQVDTVTSPAVAASGLRAGDYIVAVDGWPLPRTAGRAAARTHVIKRDGSWTTFTVRRPNGERYTIRLIRSMEIEEEEYRRAGVSRTFTRVSNAIGTLLLPVLFIPAAALLFVRRRREAVPALMSLAFLMFGAIVNAPDMIGISIRLVNTISTAATLLLFAALFAFPSGRFEPRWTAIPFLVLPVGAFLEDGTPASTMFGAAITLLALGSLISRYRKVGPGPERLQLRWAFFGLVAGVLLLLLALAGSAAASAWQAEDPRWSVWQYAFVQAAGTWGLGVMALGLIVSILRYRLYDADAVIGRSAAYGLLTLGFVVLFAGSQKVIELIGQEYLGQNLGGLAGGIGAALAAVAIAPMHARAQRWAERSFQRSLYRLRHGLPALVGDLRETSGLEQIAGATLDSLIEGVRARRAALIAGDYLIDAREIPAGEVEQWRRGWDPPQHDGIDCDRSDSLFPVRVPLEAEGHGRVGWLLLGSRPDGSLFGKTEFDAIEEIAEPVARAVQVAISREQREARYEQRLQALEKLVAELRKSPRPSVA